MIRVERSSSNERVIVTFQKNWTSISVEEKRRRFECFGSLQTRKHALNPRRDDGVKRANAAISYWECYPAGALLSPLRLNLFPYLKKDTEHGRRATTGTEE